MRPKLYGRAYCHLCEDMARALRAAGVEFDEVDVDSDPELEARFGERVPVLTDDRDNELAHYRLDPDALRKLIPAIK